MDDESNVVLEQKNTILARFRDSSQSELVIITSKLFEQFPEIKFGLSTKKGGVSRIPYGLNLSYMVGDDPNFVDQNRERFFGKLKIPLDKLAVPKQFHGEFIKFVSSPGVYDLCDALVTTSSSVYLCVTIADCIPIFLYDPVKHAVAVIHAGWRGTKLKIVEKTVKKMVREINTNPADLIVFIGPGAGVCCYEVGEDVAREFDQRYVVRYSTKKPHLNMKLFIKLQLIDQGVRDKNIEMSEYCTMCTPGLFYSFRREKMNSGRMMGVIGIEV